MTTTNNPFKTASGQEFTGKYIYKCCDKVTYTQGWNEIEVNGLCRDCQLKMIGKRVNVIRYGKIPASGQSFNSRENKYEDGVSCYLPEMSTRPEFNTRKAYKFNAVVVEFGGDDEPLIDASTIIKGWIK